MLLPHERAIAHVTKLAGGEPGDPSWRVTLHFHPDRLVNGTPNLELMARDGVYRSQFETGTSNGGLTAYPGGDRWRWEAVSPAQPMTAGRPKGDPVRIAELPLPPGGRLTALRLGVPAPGSTYLAFCGKIWQP
jgi:hypothetical protein